MMIESMIQDKYETCLDEIKQVDLTYEDKVIQLSTRINASEVEIQDQNSNLTK